MLAKTALVLKWVPSNLAPARDGNIKIIVINPTVLQPRLSWFVLPCG